MNQVKGYNQLSRVASLQPQQPPNYYKESQEQQVQTRKKFLILTLIIYTLLLICTIVTLFLVAPRIHTVAIVGTNDLHGQVFPTVLLRGDTKEEYYYGGLVYMAHMIKTLREVYAGNLLYLDSGDQFQGGIQASRLVSEGQIMNDFFIQAGLNASSIGNHEFDFQKEFLFGFLNGRNTTNLAANLVSDKGQQNFLPHQASSKLFTFQNGIKVGVIGLATVQTPSTTAGFQNNNFPPYKFLNYKEIVIEESKKLKSQGANAVLIVSHVGDGCSSNITYSIRDKESKQQECPADQVTALIDQLPEGTIHGICQGHRHRFAHQYYKGVPYMGSINGGFYFNVMELRFNARKQLIATTIEGPVPVCQRVFQNLGRCGYLEPEELFKAGKLVNWQFRGKEVKADPQLQQLLDEKYGQKMKPYLQKLAQTEILLQRKDNQQSQLSNLFTTLASQAASHLSPDFALLNTGGFRSEWTPGVIQYQHFYNMFPFDNELQVFEITGKELVDTMRVVQAGRRFVQAWNLRMEAMVYRNGTKVLESVLWANGSQIDKDRVYRGVTLSYLVAGGDQFGPAFNSVFKPKNIVTLGQFRTVIKPQLKKLGIIKKGSLIDPLNPRLIVKTQPQTIA